MLVKTHLAIVLFFILLFIGSVEHEIAFVLMALFATLLPDVDSKYSKLGRKKTFRPLQFFLKHRGIFHSFTFLIVLTLFFALFIPVLAFPFFLGYGIHLFTDSFTVDGIKPFYPYKKSSSGKIRVGSKTETSVFVVFLLMDLFMVIFRISGVF